MLFSQELHLPFLSCSCKLLVLTSLALQTCSIPSRESTKAQKVFFYPLYLPLILCHLVFSPFPTTILEDWSIFLPLLLTFCFLPGPRTLALLPNALCSFLKIQMTGVQASLGNPGWESEIPLVLNLLREG